jgi:hypothetical protein
MYRQGRPGESGDGELREDDGFSVRYNNSFPAIIICLQQHSLSVFSFFGFFKDFFSSFNHRPSTLPTCQTERDESVNC